MYFLFTKKKPQTTTNLTHISNATTQRQHEDRQKQPKIKIDPD